MLAPTGCAKQSRGYSKTTPMPLAFSAPRIDLSEPLGGGGGTPWLWTPTNPPTNCWPEAPWGGARGHWRGGEGRGDGGGGGSGRVGRAIRRSQSAPHMHVLVCICSNVQQFHNVWPGPLNRYATHSIAVAYVHMGLILSTPGGLHGTRRERRITGSLTCLWLTPVGQIIAAPCDP